MNDINTTQLNSPEWIFFVKVSFAISLLAMVFAIIVVPTDLVVKGFLAMGTLYLVASTFTLAKTVRDEFEGNKLVNKLVEARTERLLKEYARDAEAA